MRRIDPHWASVASDRREDASEVGAEYAPRLENQMNVKHVE